MPGPAATAPCRTRRSGIDVVVPPTAWPGVCARCRGPATQADTQCWCCRKVGQQLGPNAGSDPPAWPLALARRGDVLHRAIRLYKDAAAVDARRHFTSLLAQLVDDLVQQSSPELTPALDAADLLAVVPSTTRGVTVGSGHLAASFDSVLARTATFSRFDRVRFTAGGGHARHLSPDVRAFVPAGDVAGLTVVVVDDAWVTGARARSAVAALEIRGAQVAAVVVLGRIVDVEACPLNRRWWLEKTGLH